MATDPLYQRQEDLSLVVEPLVDSISELVLSAVTGDFTNVQECCMNIADRTNKLVLIAQQVATSSTDVDLQMEVATAINDVAVSIETLVTSFTEILADSNPKTQEGFARAAKSVGDAINKLCNATDSTSQQKLLNAVKDAIFTAKEVQESALISRERLVIAAQNNVEKTLKLVKIASLAANATADIKKRNMLNDGSERVKIGGPALIQAAKFANERKDSKSKEDLDQKAKELSDAFSILINAAKFTPTYFGKLDETYEYVKKLIEAASDLETAATSLYTITKDGTTEQFVEIAKLTAMKAIELVSQIENAIKSEKDFVKKQLLKESIAELRDASSNMIKASKQYRTDNSQEAKRNFEEAHQRLESAIKRVVGITQGDYSNMPPKQRMAISANVLQAAAQSVVYNAINNPQLLVEDAQVLVAIAMQLATEAELTANDLTDPKQKKKLLEAAAEIKIASQKLISAAKKVAQNPNDPVAKAELEEANKYLLEVLERVRNATNESESKTEEEQIQQLVPGTEEFQLVQAAQEEANAALQLANEAEKQLLKITDASKKAIFAAAIKDVQSLSQKVTEMAALVSKNPKDLNAQRNLAMAQKELENAIQKVVKLSNEQNNEDKELAAAMAQMKLESDSHSSETDVLKKEVLDSIAASFGSNKTLKAEEVLANAKQLSLKASELAAQLKEMAMKSNDPIYKEKLMNAAKIIRDGSIQVKILSVVKAASGDDKSNSVGMAAKGLQTNISEVIKAVQADNLRSRFRSTVKQTIAINKVVKLWRGKTTK